MAQHDMNIANQGFPATRADINNALQALASNNSGTSAPSTTFANQWWYDTNNNKLYIRNEANNAWIQVAVLDQTNAEWQIITGVIQAKDGDGLVFQTDDGTTRVSIDDAGNVGVVGATKTTALSSAAHFDTLGLTVDDNTAYNNVGVGGGIAFRGKRNTSGTQTVFGAIDVGKESAANDSFTGSLRFYTNNNSTGIPTEHMVIDSVGNLNIGSDANVGYGPLQVGSTSSANTIIQMLGTTTGNNSIHFGDGTSGAARYSGYINYAHNGNTMQFSANGAERMRIDNSSVLIGTTSGAFNNDAKIVLVPNSDSIITNNGQTLSLNRTSTDGTIIGFYKDASGVGSISVTGSATAYNTSSDYRLKENVADISDGITRVKQLSPKRFNFIADADTTVDGFIAHEAQTVVPEAITGEKDAMKDEEYTVTAAKGDVYTPATDDADEVVHSSNVEQPDTLEEGHRWRETAEAVMGTRSVPDIQGIDQSKIVPLLTAALQEAIAKIETLETKVAALEG